MIGFIFSLLGLTITLMKGAFQALAVIYPSYKTYKALESRSLRAAQAMLLYWTITAFVGSLKEFADQLFGTYANFFVWKLTIVALKAAPLIIGPDRLYDNIVKPFYEANEEKIDAVVDEAHKLKSLAEPAVSAAKAGDVDSVKGTAAEIASVVKEDATDLVHTLQQQALQLTDQLQAKTAELGVQIDRKGLSGLLEQTIAQFERLRDYVLSFAGDRWQEHGPLVKKQTATLSQKARQYAPIAREKVTTLYRESVAPRFQPLVNKYDSTMKPFVLSKVDRVNGLWMKHGGPVRSAYTKQVRPFLRGTLQPFVTEQFIPWLIDSFIPAVVETFIVLKERLSDLASTPSDEVKAGRLHHKRRRAEARREKRRSGLNPFAAEWKEDQHAPGTMYKRQKTNTSDVSEAKSPELTQEKDTTGTGADVVSSSSSKSPEINVPGTSGLHNRKNKSLNSQQSEKTIVEHQEEVKPIREESKPIDKTSSVNSTKEAAPLDMSAKNEPDIKSWKDFDTSKLAEDTNVVPDANTNSKEKLHRTGSGEKDVAWGSESRANERISTAE